MKSALKTYFSLLHSCHQIPDRNYLGARIHFGSWSEGAVYHDRELVAAPMVLVVSGVCGWDSLHLVDLDAGSLGGNPIRLTYKVTL